MRKSFAVAALALSFIAGALLAGQVHDGTIWITFTNTWRNRFTKWKRRVQPTTTIWEVTAQRLRSIYGGPNTNYTWPSKQQRCTSTGFSAQNSTGARGSHSSNAPDPVVTLAFGLPSPTLISQGVENIPIYLTAQKVPKYPVFR